MENECRKKALFTCKVVVLLTNSGWVNSLQPQSVYMALNHLWGISVTATCCVVLWKWLQVLQWGKRLKNQASEASRAGVWGGELGPFPLLSPPLGSLCLPFFCFVFVLFFSVSPQLLPFLPTTERGPRPAIDGFCVVVRRHMACL